MNEVYIQAIKAAFRLHHHCDATHLETVPVIETFNGRPVWEGDVEVFQIHGHPKAKRGYGWGFREGDNIETGCFYVYDTDGSTLLYRSPPVTMQAGDIWRYSSSLNACGL